MKHRAWRLSLAACAAAFVLTACEERTADPGNAANGAAASAPGSPSPPAAAANGTASANAAAPATPAAAAGPAKPNSGAAGGPWSPTGYALNGTEPFWGGDITGTKVRYMVPEDQFGDVVPTSAAYGAAQETYSGRYAGHPFVLTLTRGPCSNGMSDHSYAYTAVLRVKGETRQGCADPQ